MLFHQIQNSSNQIGYTTSENQRESQQRYVLKRRERMVADSWKKEVFEGEGTLSLLVDE